MAIAALQAPASLTAGIRKVYQKRRDILVPGLQRLGFELRVPKASFYAWIRIPRGKTSAAYAGELLEKAGIVATPGNGFGAEGEGYIRMTMTAPAARLRLALERLAALG
jgi:LL-diaminopimelate aminotransferase